MQTTEDFVRAVNEKEAKHWHRALSTNDKARCLIRKRFVHVPWQASLQQVFSLWYWWQKLSCLNFFFFFPIIKPSIVAIGVKLGGTVRYSFPGASGVPSAYKYYSDLAWILMKKKFAFVVLKKFSHVPLP